jgi:hypothetical protein
MPTVIRQDGFRIVIYTNDHLPAHVHVIKANAEIRIQLGSEGESPQLLTIDGDISNKEVAKALYLVKEHQIELLNKWREIHGDE